MFMRLAAAATVPAIRNQKNDASDDDAAFFRVMGYFRATNAEGLRIRARMEAATTLPQPSAPEAVLLAFSDAHQMIRKEIEEARRRAEIIEELRNSDPEEHAWYAREFVQATNAWDDLSQIWPAEHGGAVSADQLASRAKQSIPVLDAMIFTCALQTIPNELNNYLENYRIGKALDFLATFKDQLPDEASTREVLAKLAPQSGIISGLVDLDNAKIIKADDRWWRQVMSVVWVLAVAATGFGLAAIAVHLGIWLQFSPSDWPANPQQWTALNGAYLLVLLGVLGHWVLDRLKQDRAGADVAPLSEWLMWIHINEVPITIRIATVWVIVMLGVAFKQFDLSKGVVPTMYFTAGYFMDSTFDALIGRFNTFISNNDPAKKSGQKTAG